MLKEKSCGAVVFFNTFDPVFLILRYGAGHWDFVKGNVELDESEHQTVKRELEEETGIIEACFVEGFREKIAYFYRRQGKTVHKEVVFFLIQVDDIKVQLSYEHERYYWSNYRNAFGKLTFRNSKEVLRKANDLLKMRGLTKGV